MTDFNAWLDGTDEEKKKKQTPSQQAAITTQKNAPGKKMDFNAWLDTKPTPTPKTTVTT